jgi:hypothetical protein
VRLFQPASSACRLSLLGFIDHVMPRFFAQNTCQLKSTKGNIKHVIYVQFDNTQIAPLGAEHGVIRALKEETRICVSHVKYVELGFKNRLWETRGYRLRKNSDFGWRSAF